MVHLNKFESPSPKDALCQFWLKLAQWFWGKRFLNFVDVFLQFRNNFPLKRAGPFIWTNLNLVHARMHCAKFGWHSPSGSIEEDFEISSMYFLYFVIISPWKRAESFIWTNLNTLHPTMLCAKFGWKLLWRKRWKYEKFTITPTMTTTTTENG